MAGSRKRLLHLKRLRPHAQRLCDVDELARGDAAFVLFKTLTPAGGLPQWPCRARIATSRASRGTGDIDLNQLIEAVRTAGHRWRDSKDTRDQNRRATGSLREQVGEERASPLSFLAPLARQRGRLALTALGWMGTTGCPASMSASTMRPNGRSRAMGRSPGWPKAASL